MLRLRFGFWRLLSYLFLVASLFALARVALPEGWFAFWVGSQFGSTIDDYASRIARWFFAPGSPAMPAVRLLEQGISFLRIELTTGNLVSAVLGALGVGSFNLIYNWARNWSIRRMCSSMLYVSAFRIMLNIGVIYDGFTRNGKPFFESLKNKENVNTLTLKNSNDVRSALHRLKCEMETLQDFSIAYDYAIWRGLRFFTAKVRIRAMAVREALEVAVAEIELAGTPEINFRPARLGVSAAMATGHRYLNLTDALYPVLSSTIELAERLEVGFIRSLFLWWWPASGASLPSTAPQLRADVHKYLIQWRHKYWASESKNPESWDTLWIASGGALPLPPRLVEEILEQTA